MSTLLTPPMTTRNAVDEALSTRCDFRKVTNGLWENRERTARVFASGNDPTQDWKVFQLIGTRFEPVEGGVGSGKQALMDFLATHPL